MRRLIWVATMALLLAACGNGDAEVDAADGSSSVTVDAAPTTAMPASTATSIPPRSGEILALTYNVAGLPEILSGSRPTEFTPQIGPLLNRYELVLVQESWRTPDPNPLAPLRVYHEILEESSQHEQRSAPKPLPLGSDPARPEALVSDGLNRFSDVPFDPVQRTAWSECFGGADENDGGAGDCLSQKGFSVAATMLDDDVVVDVYNLHLEAGGTEEDQHISRAQAQQVATFIAEHSADRPVIVGGDFNLHTDPEQADDPDEAWDLESFRIILETTGLTDVCAAVDCPEPGRIDKFLFRSSEDLTIEPLDWNFETDVFVSAEGEPLSDHDPLAVTFRWTLRS